MTQEEALEAIIRSKKVLLTPSEVGRVLGSHSSYVADVFRSDDRPFKPWISGNRVKIPRMKFLQWLGCQEGGETDGETPGEDHGGLG